MKQTVEGWLTCGLVERFTINRHVRQTPDGKFWYVELPKTWQYGPQSNYFEDYVEGLEVTRHYEDPCSSATFKFLDGTECTGRDQ